MKLFRLSFAALALLLSPAAFPADAHEGHLPQTEGIIKKIDPASGKITIAHGEIKNLNMPAMTMSFKAKTPAVLANWKIGDKVLFRAADVKGALILVSIDAAK